MLYQSHVCLENDRARMIEQLGYIQVSNETKTAPTLQNNVFQIFHVICHDNKDYLQSEAKNIGWTTQLQTVEDKPTVLYQVYIHYYLDQVTTKHFLIKRTNCCIWFVTI